MNRVGDTVELHGLTAIVERINDSGPNELVEVVLLRVSGPVDGYVGLLAWETGVDTSTAVVAGRFFSDDASTYIEHARDSWKKWLDELAAEAVDLRRSATA
ncbi:MAG: hypothetical protein ABIQ73_06600 [Acidimicrobiales bacterium]